jgi:hypothetical protein
MSVTPLSLPASASLPTAMVLHCRETAWERSNRAAARILGGLDAEVSPLTARSGVPLG